MKKVRFLWVLMLGCLFVTSCHKLEGDEIPEVNKTLSYELDSTGVFRVATSSSSGVFIDVLKIFYMEQGLQAMSHNTADSVILKDVFVKGNTPVDTLWKLEPNKVYEYCVVIKDFTQMSVVDTISDTTQVVMETHMINSRIPKVVKADSAWVAHDTLWLSGTVRSHWRPLMDSIGLTRDLKFIWGATESLTDTVVAQIVKDTLEGTDLNIDLRGIIPMNELQGVNQVWYRTYVKNAWGIGEKCSDIRSVTISSPGKAE